ncbi:MAG TPA: Flp pilus assembly protein CpaB [Rhizomicrobium sp.]|nr:Flp pilus assembly protein CpaB [Rhizomicrobium sp.]
MNRSRVVFLGLAAFAAIAAALLLRGLLGGGTTQSNAMPAPPPVAMNDVLVASTNLQPGVALSDASVRWQKWPASAVDDSFITKEKSPDVDKFVKGAVVRAPLVSGEPLSVSKIVHADAAGFMAATLQPGMRAASIAVSAESGAGGFILPNDRVDVLVTRQVSNSPARYSTRTILSSVRVLAIDQTSHEDKDQKVVVGKTATLEVTPAQAESLSRAQASGTLSLSLRALGDNGDSKALAAADTSRSNDVAVIRYGISGGANAGGGE